MFQNYIPTNSLDLRTVQPIVNSTSHTNTVLKPSAPNMSAPQVFSESPVSVSISDYHLKSSRSMFDHTSFESNLPISQTRCSNRIKLKMAKSKTIKKNTVKDSDILRVCKMTSTPEILKAVGLNRSPKCYSNKKRLIADINPPETTYKMVFLKNADFGRIDWEQRINELS